MADNATPGADLTNPMRSRVRASARQLMERGEHAASALLSGIRPRVSLASGSALVLLTLLLPIGYESCGPERPGYQLLQGEGEWPTFLGILVSETAGRDFYILLLAIAALTALFTVCSFFRPGLCRASTLTLRAFVLSGTTSLVLMSDASLILLLAEDRYTSGAVALGLVSCAAPGLFWPRCIIWGWLSGMAITLSLSAIADTLQWASPDPSEALAFVVAAIGKPW